MPSSTIPSCSCGWLCSGTVAPGSKRMRFSIAPSPNSGRPETPAASSNARTCVETYELWFHALDYRCPRDRGRGSAASAAGIRGRGSGSTPTPARRSPSSTPRRASRSPRCRGWGRRRRDARSPRPSARCRRGRRARRRTAPACCAGSPTSCSSARTTSRGSWCSSRASRSPRRASRSPTPPRSTSGSARRRSGSTATPSRRPWPDKRIHVTKEPVGVTARDHALELPGGDADAQVRAGARGWLHDGAEARRADAALRACDRRARGGGGRAGGRLLRRDRRRRGCARDRRRDDLEPLGAQARVHGLERGREDPHGAVRAGAQEDLARARRERAVHRVRRCRPRRRGRRRDHVQVPQLRADLHLGEPAARAGGRLRRLPRAASPKRCARSKWRTGSPRASTSGRSSTSLRVEKVERHVADAVERGAPRSSSAASGSRASSSSRPCSSAFPPTRR